MFPVPSPLRQGPRSSVVTPVAMDALSVAETHDDSSSSNGEEDVVPEYDVHSNLGDDANDIIMYLRSGQPARAIETLDRVCLAARRWPPPRGMPLYLAALAAAGTSTAMSRATQRFYATHTRNLYCGGDREAATIARIVGLASRADIPPEWYDASGEVPEMSPCTYTHAINLWVMQQDQEQSVITDLVDYVANALELVYASNSADFAVDESPPWGKILQRAMRHTNPLMEWPTRTFEQFVSWFAHNGTTRIGSGKAPDLPRRSYAAAASSSMPAGRAAAAASSSSSMPAGRAATAAAESSEPSVSEQLQKQALRLAAARPDLRQITTTSDEPGAPTYVTFPVAGNKCEIARMPYPETMVAYYGQQVSRDRERAPAVPVFTKMREKYIEIHDRLWKIYMRHPAYANRGDNARLWFHGTTAAGALALARGITLYSPFLQPYQDFNGTLTEDYEPAQEGRDEYWQGAFYLGLDLNLAIWRAVSGAHRKQGPASHPVVMVYALETVPRETRDPGQKPGIVRAKDMGVENEWTGPSDEASWAWRRYVAASRVNYHGDRKQASQTLRELDPDQTEEEARMGPIAALQHGGDWQDPGCITAFGATFGDSRGGVYAHQLALKTHAAADRANRALVAIIAVGAPSVSRT